jgi:large subunit ribosomal protein L6
MSRIGKIPVPLPQGVQVAVTGQQVSAKGPKGALQLTLVEGISAKVENNQVVISRASDEQHLRAMHGTTRALVKNMVHGVAEGYQKNLEIVGVGYRATLQGKKIALNVGFANIIDVAIPNGVTVTVPDQTKVSVTGCDKDLVGRVAAEIRATRKPEPYKGKGVRYAGEVVRKKAGKSAAGAGAKK